MLDSTNCRDIGMILHSTRLHAVQKFMMPKVLIEYVLDDEFVVVDEFWIGSEIKLEEQHVNHTPRISTTYLEQCLRWYYMHQFGNTLSWPKHFSKQEIQFWEDVAACCLPLPLPFFPKTRSISKWCLLAIWIAVPTARIFVLHILCRREQLMTAWE